MNVLVIGSGGREHALAWKLSQSTSVQEIFCAPGNAGTAQVGHNVNVNPIDSQAIIDFTAKTDVSLVVIGPEAPLVAGVADELRGAGIDVFGPNRSGAMLEGSKSFAKKLMHEAGIPTGQASMFTDQQAAVDYLGTIHFPVVIKADGLAAGKGVFIVADQAEAEAALDDCFGNRRFGSAGDLVLIEEFLIGEEASVLAFTDGSAVLPMTPAQDYKRIHDDDQGPNTGGMGSYSPVPAVDSRMFDRIVAEIIEPTVSSMSQAGIDFRGVIYAGIIMTDMGPKVLEFNARFGDPETQAILPRLDSDLGEIMMATARKELSGMELRWSDKVCVSVVLASGGYPGEYQSGLPIIGLEAAQTVDGITVFHAGTALRDGQVVTDGGRVLNVSSLGADYQQARDQAYAAIDKIGFNGMQFRRDIAERACKAVI